MLECHVSIEPTPLQLAQLCGPPTLESVKVADFLGKQDYIDRWILDWFHRNDYSPADLPLCIYETLSCFPKMKRKYKRCWLEAIFNNNVEWLKKHNIIDMKPNWSKVDFYTVSDEMFEYLFELKPVPFLTLPFVVITQRLGLFKTFADHHGLTKCLACACKQRWPEAVKYCVDNGADLSVEDFVSCCILCSETFRLITESGGHATKVGYDEFVFQKMLGRVPDVFLVEEFFWIHGFK